MAGIPVSVSHHQREDSFRAANAAHAMPARAYFINTMRLVNVC